MEPIHLLTTLNEGYLPQLQVMLTSLAVNNPKETFALTLLHSGIPGKKAAGRGKAVRGRSACNAPRPKADGSRWNEIYELNRSIIQDYNLIYIGQVFKLPKL